MELVDAGRFPAATLLVNVTGSFLLGVVTFAGVGGDALLFVGTGACGTFTTPSSFAFETVRLGEGRWVRRSSTRSASWAAAVVAGKTAVG